MYSSYKGPCFVSSYQRHYLSGIPDRTFWLKRFREAVDIFGKIVPTERKEGKENEKEPFTGAWSVCSVTNLSERLRINLHQTRSLPVRGFDPCSFLLDPKTKLKVLWNIFHYLLHFSPLSTFHFFIFSLSLMDFILGPAVNRPFPGSLPTSRLHNPLFLLLGSLDGWWRMFCQWQRAFCRNGGLLLSFQDNAVQYCTCW